MTAETSRLETATILVVGPNGWLDRFVETLKRHTGASVHRAETATQALEVVECEPIDCLVTEYALTESTGIELVEQLREFTTLPVVLATTAGSEAIASKAISAGVTDYVPVSEPIDETAMVERTNRALCAVGQTITRRKRAQQFDAIFHDSQTATWVLEADGSLDRANETARAMIDVDVESIVGDPFWTLPWWSHTAVTKRDVRRLVEKAANGQFGDAVVFQPRPDTQRVVDLSVRPVEDERGDLVSIVVEGIDITEQVHLERDLRQSETLHRVTLNNMTDTILVTNEAGEYTYVCPNVHFIFGYTAEEIHEQGTIDELLSDDLFDREKLAETGVLKNIECTATDKAGREHTLLVNVREVSIQGGTLLYSCRDVTKRKQREEALATLQETAREFLYAETHQEIAQHIVDDVPSVLDLPASAVYMYDVDANELRPTARSQRMTDLNGPLSTLPADGQTLPSHSFVTDEHLSFDDVHSSDRLENRATGLRSVMYIPLGDHGVFVAGSDETDAFDDIVRELADLLAATAEAALDRVSRESQLREQDRELKRQNDQLTTLNRINATIREIDQGIVQAETREEITHTVCERLTDTDRFEFAWVGSVDPVTETVDPQAWAGTEQGYLDSRSIAVAASGTDPAGQTAATGKETMVANVAEDLRADPWRADALTRNFLSVLSIPLTYNDLTHGVLTVYAETRNAFGETTRAVLTELGETIAAALSAIERKHALLTASMTRVELEIDDPTFLLSRLADANACTISYQGGVGESTDGNQVFVSVTETAVDAFVETAAGMAIVDDAVTISTNGSEEGVVQLQLAQPFLAVELADHGALFQEATASPDQTTLVVDVPDTIDIQKIVQLLRETFAAVTLRRKQTLETPAEYDLHSRVLEEITDRQLEVLQTAYYSGYFESPRENTGEAIAETLEISPPAFYQHIRAVQRTLFTALFEETNSPALPQRVQ